MHAVLSPSGAHRWMRCPGSAALESAVPDVSSVYADEGTAAHTLATWVLKSGTATSLVYLGETIEVGEREFEVTRDMADYVDTYVLFVRKLAAGKMLFVEQRVPVDHLTGEPGAGGTADVIIVDAAACRLIVIDLKYGMGVRVDAQENEQTRIYGLGAFEKYSYLCDFKEVEMIIHQPRLDHVSSEILSLKDMALFGEDVANCSVIATDAIALFAAGATAEEIEAEGYLAPSEDACRWCNAKATCPALRRMVGEAVTAGSVTIADFAEVMPLTPDAAMDADILSVCMGKIDLIEAWSKAVRAEVERRLFEGQEVPGYKLVQGKQGNRAWVDKVEAERVLRAMKLKVSDIFDTSLISPTTAEKLLKDQPSRWKSVEAVITRAPGKPSVAPVTDKRPALAIVATAEDFGELIKE